MANNFQAIFLFVHGSQIKEGIKYNKIVYVFGGIFNKILMDKKADRYTKGCLHLNMIENLPKHMANNCSVHTWFTNERMHEIQQNCMVLDEFSRISS